MATLKQLLKLQQQVDAAESKLNDLREKRREMINALGLKRPSSFSQSRQENFVSIDGLPVRLWVNIYGDLEIENLTF
jgi:hypothetical protein